MYDHTDGAAQRITLERPRDGGIVQGYFWERDGCTRGRGGGVNHAITTAIRVWPTITISGKVTNRPYPTRHNWRNRLLALNTSIDRQRHNRI